MKYFFIAIISIILPFSNVWSSTIIVDINGTGDYTSIQEGIDNASDGDIVLVYPGTYCENIDYCGKNITVASKYYTTGDELYIKNTIIDGNRTGSVVSLFNGETDANICGFTIQNGKSVNEFYDGGGIYLDEVTISISDCIIQDNEASSGGGIMSYPSSNIFLEHVTIRNNYAHTAGGGIYLSGESTLYFAENSRCNIFMNYSPIGSDICTNYFGDLEIIVDTFTVDNPDKFYVYSITDDAFTYDILNHKIYTINQDVYITPYGNNENSGLSWSEAFKNIYHALIMVRSDSTHPNTIYVDEGTYSPSTTGEFFALKGKEYISIIGAGKELTILDAEQTNKLFLIKDVLDFAIKQITLKNGYNRLIGGIDIQKNSNPIIKDVKLVDNNIQEWGKVHIDCNQNCNPIFENVYMTTTYSQVNSRAISISGNCTPIFIKCIIEKNRTNPSVGNFGAMAAVTNSYPILINCTIANNYGDICSGIRETYGPDDNIYVINCTIADNDVCSQGTISLVYDAHMTFINTILRNDPETEIWFHPQHDPNSVSLEYCNIEGGIDAINTNNNGTVNWGDGNIDEDPLFVGGNPFSYELTPQSPCLDAGTTDTTGLHLPATDLAGNPRIFNGRIDIGAYECQDTVSVEEPDTSFIHNLYLFQNTPNPFTNETEILFITADYERVEDYSLSIYNTKGQLVRRFDGRTNDFWVKTKIVWDGTDEQGKQVAPGTYLYKLEYNGNAVVRKMVKLR